MKASLEQLQLNYDAIKKTTKSENIAQFENEFNQMLHDLKIYEERIQSLEQKLIEKDNIITDLNNQIVHLNSNAGKNKHDEIYQNYANNLNNSN